MRFNPDAAVDMLPEGQYNAVVKRAMEKISKNGNEMIELILTVYGNKGAKVDVFDYLLSTDDWAFKVRHFCESAGLDFASGVLEPQDCEEKNVRVWLTIQKQTGYQDKNGVKDYLPRNHVGDAGGPPPHEDSDIPF